ncbi:MAG TPA: GAF domain-containing sensor histidine kinase [Solirubrobacteraceae bacterium]|nr:GAF domain-containing sensor histidine kinase [Solirubrobacteraceae bacterium]
MDFNRLGHPIDQAPASVTEQRLRRLLQVGRSLVGELDPELVLARILEEACAMTDAQYAALGVLDEDRNELERFLTRGIDPAAQGAIGDLPRGRGVLGVLIDEPCPLRLSDVGAHPQSYGFPAHHPPMHSFLGVPIMIRGRAWGNLYLTEKADGGEFTAEDEEAAVVLAEWAGTAIENARLYESSEQGRREAERAVRGLEASRDIADAVGEVPDLERVLELIAKRGRALVDARTVLIMLREGEELVVAASAGHAKDAKGRRLPVGGSTSGQVLQRGRPARIADVAAEMRIAVEELGVPGAGAALLVPMLHHGSGIGVLAAFDRSEEGGEFSVTDEQLLRTFGASAANAVALSRSVAAERLQSAIGAADAERGRWARELHDETLQALGGLRVLLSSALRRSDADAQAQAMRQAIEDIELEIGNLRAIISDLRPSLLDDLGLFPAIEALLDRRRQSGLEITSDFTFPASADGAALTPEIETTIYRILQESLTNVVKHAGATRVDIRLAPVDSDLVIEVSDDGNGFDTRAGTEGFGLAGIRERVYLAGGQLEVESGSAGTRIRARLPVTSRVPAIEQVAS